MRDINLIEGQYAMWVAFLEPGDEVILFEPWFDQYLPSITFNHGVPVFVPLTPPAHSDLPLSSADWVIDFDQLRAAITPKTKMIVVNTPHNPVGKVFTREELVKIGDLAKEFNLLVMADEVVSRTIMLKLPSDKEDSTIVYITITQNMSASQIYLACGRGR